MQKRLSHRSANVQLLVLTVSACHLPRTLRLIRVKKLAGALVNNCGATLHREISGKPFTSKLVQVVNDRVSAASVSLCRVMLTSPPEHPRRCQEEDPQVDQGLGHAAPQQPRL